MLNILSCQKKLYCWIAESRKFKRIKRVPNVYTFYSGVLIHCPLLKIVLWKRTMPGYQKPSAKQSIQESILKIQHIATMSVTVYWQHASSSKLKLEETRNSPQNYGVDACRCSLHQKALLWSGHLLKCRLMWAWPLDGPSILTLHIRSLLFETKRWHSTADVWNGELQSWNLRPGRQSLKRVSASHGDQPTWPHPDFPETRQVQSPAQSIQTN